MPADSFNSPEFAWQPSGCLFPGLAPGIERDLHMLHTALATVRPLNAAHKKSLPRDIRDLSEILTSNRSELRHPYWNTPRFVSAYLYYFLPWNILRLCRLFSGLSLQPPHIEGRHSPLLLDIASGPLTLPIALWLARPAWRRLPVTVLAVDAHKHPLALGQELFAALADVLGESCWQVKTMQGSIFTGVARHCQTDNSNPWLMTCANALNEVAQCRKKQRYADAENESEASSLPQMERILAGCESFHNLLFVEPGTRLGGNTIMNLRQSALEYGFAPLEPCTHARSCPLDFPDTGKRNHPWCHFTYSASHAPQWLERLSLAAGLRKTSLSLSFLLLARETPGPGDNARLQTRIISQAFDLPDQKCKARYGCAKTGLVILKNSQNCPGGCLVNARIPDNPARDAKSGAIFIEPASMPSAPKSAIHKKSAHKGMKNKKHE